MPARSDDGASPFHAGRRVPRTDSVHTGTSFNRRALFCVLGLGGVAAAAGFSDSASARQSAPPPATPTSSPEIGGLTLRAKAAELGFDVERIFRFVADEVQYDAYAGALRGAKGTLWGLAGNSVDQAMLLTGLLREALVPSRFAIGSRDAAGAETLLDTASLDEDTTRTRAVRTLTTLPPADQVPPITVTAEQEAALAALPDEADRLIAAARAQLADGLDVVAGALEAAGIQLPERPVLLPRLERERHVWIQYADGAAWVDLDPSMPAAEFGTAYASIAETVDALPDELFHRVTFRLTAETMLGGLPTRSELVRHEANATDLIGVPITAMNARPESYKGLGLSLTGLLTGVRQYVPYLLIDGEPVRGNALLSFGVDADRPLAGGSAGLEHGAHDGETLAQWLEVEILSPDAEPVLIEREIFDRIGVAARAAGEVDVTALPPIELTTIDADSPPVYLPAHHAVIMAVACGALPFAYFVQDPAVVDDSAGLGLVGQGFHLMRDVLAVEAGAGHGYRYFLNAPNIVAFGLRPLGWSGLDGAVESGLDILHRSLEAVPLLGATPTTHPGIVAGILSAVAERFAFGDGVPTGETAADTTTVIDPGDALVITIGAVFEEALQRNVAIRVITRDDADSAFGLDSEYSRDAVARMRGLLTAGHVVIVPSKPVSLAGRDLTGWWVVDPATGAVWDMLETGQGPAASEEASLTAEEVKFVPRYRRLGCKLLGILGIATSAAILGTLVGGNTGKALGITAAALGFGGGVAGRQLGPSDPFGGKC